MRDKTIFRKFICRRVFLIVGVALAVVVLAALGMGTMAAADSEAVTVTKTATPNEVPRGTPVQYTAAFVNDGTETVYLNVIRDTLPSGFSFLSMVAGSDITDLPEGTTGTIVWTGGPYPVLAGETVHLIYSVLADAPYNLTPYYNRVEADLSTGGTIFSVAGVTVQAPFVTGSKVASLAQVFARTPVNYTVTLNNTGNADATVGPIVDTLPAHFSFVEMVSDPSGVGDPVVVGQTLTWAGPHTVAPAGTLQFTYKVRADGVGGQIYYNSVTATYNGGTAGPYSDDVKILTNYTFVYLPIVFTGFNINPPLIYRLAYETKPLDNYEIYAVNADGTDRVNISNSAGGDLDPAWSPDGSKIAWVHYAGDTEIWVSNADGTNRQALTSNDADDLDPEWSPDGTKIAFRSERDGRWEVYVMNADGASQTRMTNESCQSTLPLWSPDGTKIAFLCGLDTYADVWVMDANGGNKVNLTSDDDQDGAVAWSPDSAYLAYVRSPLGYDTEIFKVNVASHTITKLTNNSVDDYSPQWSPNGLKIVFSTKFTTFDIAVMNADGSNVVNLTNWADGDYVPKWSPDGLFIAFIATRNGNKELYVMNADGSSQFRLTDTGADESNYNWRPLVP